MWVARIEYHDQKRTLRLRAVRTYSIGRGSRADIRIPDRTMSRQHCMLAPHEGRWRVIDLGSKSGVTVNGEACRDRVLEDEDLVELSSHTRLRVFRREDAHTHPEPRRRRFPVGVLLLLLVAAGAAGAAYHFRVEIQEYLAGRPPASRFAALDTDACARELYDLAARPDPAALDDLLALDGELTRLDRTRPGAGVHAVKVGRALLGAFVAAARSGDDRAFQALCERTDRPGVVSALLGSGKNGVDHVLDQVAAGRLAAHRVAADLERVADPAAFPRMRAVAADASKDAVLRERALAALATRDAAPPDDELLALIEQHREHPFDRGREMVAARAATLLAGRDPERFGALADEFRRLRQRRHEVRR